MIPAASLQPDLFAEPTPTAPANLERESHTTTTDAPVLYRCGPCERRTKRPQLWRRSIRRTTTTTEYWHPAIARQVRLVNVEWTPVDGRAHQGQHPPTDRCPSCKLPTTGRPIRGHYNAARRCDARCMYAKGPDCECSCGGANHGIGHHHA